jgi:flagellar basal-body rod protein FlgG
MNKVASRTGILTYQDNLDIIANNMANVNTDGFKPFRASLADLIYTTRDPENEDTQYGHGVRVQKSDLMYSQGARRDTGRDLDFFAAGDAFFSVEDLNGDRYFTKYGAFQITQTEAETLDADGNVTAPGVWELTDNANGFVLDENGEHIQVPFVTAEDGTVSTVIDYETLQTLVGMFTFSNPYGMNAVGDNYYAQTESSGAPVLAEDALPMRGALEGSGVEIAKQMTDMMITQRAFSLNIQMLKTYSELTSLVNNLKG